MDLGTVAETLDRMQYHDAGAFVADVRLIFDNARKYNPPKHPIHVAASKLSKVSVVRPTAPGKSSIPWEHNAVGPLSQLARQTWAALCVRTSRTVDPMPTMAEDSTVETASSSSAQSQPQHQHHHAVRSLGGSGGISKTSSDTNLDTGYASSAGPERLSRSESTAIMSVSEFYGPAGARMLQRRGSTASAQSFADCYGATEDGCSGAGGVGRGGRDDEEQREGQEALSVLMADGRSEEERGGGGGSKPSKNGASSGEVCPTRSQAESQPAVHPAQPGTMQVTAAAETVAAAAAIEGVTGSRVAAEPAQEQQGASGAVTVLTSASANPVSTPSSSVAATTSAPSSVVVAPTPNDGLANNLTSVPLLVLTPPHPASDHQGVNQACASRPAAGAAATVMTVTGGVAGQARGGPAASTLVPLAGHNDHSTSGGNIGGNLTTEITVRPLQHSNAAYTGSEGAEHTHAQKRQSRAMSLDSSSVSVSRASTVASADTTGLGGGVSRASSRSESLGLSIGGGHGTGAGVGSGVVGGVGSANASSGPHSPRLRAQSIDAAAGTKGRKKGKAKRGKGPGTAVMGKADRIGRMLQSLSRAVTRISKDLLVVSLGEPDRPARPPPPRAASGMTNEEMLAELEAWHASSGLDGVLTPDCQDPDPPISRALVDARHTFLEMCQYRHYQFDTLRRAKHSSAMVLYHLHRPESRSLNPFCSRCHRPVRFVRYHCGVCNYDLCSACDEEVSTKCEDGHDLTPYRVTFSTEDAEKSPAAGRTTATGVPAPSPPRPSRPDASPAGSVVVGRGSGGSDRICSGSSTANSNNAAGSASCSVSPLAGSTRGAVGGIGGTGGAGAAIPNSRPHIDDRLFSTSPQRPSTQQQQQPRSAQPTRECDAQNASAAGGGGSTSSDGDAVGASAATASTAPAVSATQKPTSTAAVSLLPSLANMDVGDDDTPPGYSGQTAATNANAPAAANGNVLITPAAATVAAVAADTEFVLRTRQS
ncbi:unnamed protein product [Sphacelaria rigidula]